MKDYLNSYQPEETIGTSVPSGRSIVPTLTPGRETFHDSRDTPARSPIQYPPGGTNHSLAQTLAADDREVSDSAAAWALPPWVALVGKRVWVRGSAGSGSASLLAHRMPSRQCLDHSALWRDYWRRSTTPGTGMHHRYGHSFCTGRAGRPRAARLGSIPRSAASFPTTAVFRR